MYYAGCIHWYGGIDSIQQFAFALFEMKPAGFECLIRIALRLQLAVFMTIEYDWHLRKRWQWYMASATKNISFIPIRRINSNIQVSYMTDIFDRFQFQFPGDEKNNKPKNALIFDLCYYPVSLSMTIDAFHFHHMHSNGKKPLRSCSIQMVDKMSKNLILSHLAMHPLLNFMCCLILLSFSCCRIDVPCSFCLILLQIEENRLPFSKIVLFFL